MPSILDFFISSAWAQEQAAPQPPGLLFNLFFFLSLLLLFYFFLIRPQQRRAKEHTKLLEGLKAGDEVMIDSGIMGRLVELSDNTAVLEISEGVNIKVRRPSINAVLPKGTLEKL
ncbi:preprotein translocase subunit YajC [Candidatus Nitrosacidococcus tergens]|uniref:Sec translocon accessory complex subunit YajC n=1 Tax=Candidatus Nitrosacidococcus tergens TaxID=553981 RepID=A0A7G1Q7U5_9GAMM|nr:preprotein translocase subunit YajC [Candidatus Nitrosacidococcus tergens]CAB1274752.1 Preprotein translocase, YajC subunit [Candidatus Nitrosacidococcus tergens]